MYFFWTVHIGRDVEEFWRLSWYNFCLYVQRHFYQEKLRIDEWQDEWLRFRTQWADFRNANRPKGKKAVKGSDLIKLPLDDKKVEYHPIDADAVKRRLGGKIKKRGKK